MPVGLLVYHQFHHILYILNVTHSSVTILSLAMIGCLGNTVQIAMQRTSTLKWFSLSYYLSLTCLSFWWFRLKHRAKAWLNSKNGPGPMWEILGPIDRIVLPFWPLCSVFFGHVYVFLCFENFVMYWTLCLKVTFHAYMNVTLPS